MLIFYCIVNIRNLWLFRMKVEIKNTTPKTNKRKVKNKNISYTMKNFLLAHSMPPAPLSLYICTYLLLCSNYKNHHQFHTLIAGTTHERYNKKRNNKDCFIRQGTKKNTTNGKPNTDWLNSPCRSQYRFNEIIIGIINFLTIFFLFTVFFHFYVQEDINTLMMHSILYWQLSYRSTLVVFDRSTTYLTWALDVSFFKRFSF